MTTQPHHPYPAHPHQQHAYQYQQSVQRVPHPIKLQYSRTEAAAMLGVSQRTLDRLIAEKELLVRRIGRRVLIPAAALTSFAKRDHPILGVVSREAVN